MRYPTWEGLRLRLIGILGRVRRTVRDASCLPFELASMRKSGRRPYILCGAAYLHYSAGTRACHRLLHELNERGFKAYSMDPINPAFNEIQLSRVGLWLLRVASDPIAIYPEVVSGNPLKLDHVARWVCNKPGYLGGDSHYDESELVFAWSRAYYDTDRILTVDVVERELFNSNHLPPKTLDCFYVGKAAFRGVEPGPLTAGMTEITRAAPHWPPTRRELADLLRRTRVLYTYDDVTAIQYEALLCGCRVVLLPENRELTEADMLREPMEADHASQVSRFIKESQALGR